VIGLVARRGSRSSVHRSAAGDKTKRPYSANEDDEIVPRRIHNRISFLTLEKVNRLLIRPQGASARSAGKQCGRAVINMWTERSSLNRRPKK
jgi:hypothetical protein